VSNWKKFIAEQLEVNHPRDDYREFLQLAGLMVGVSNATTFRKPGAIYKARGMAKAIYTLKIELLLDGNESVIELTARELQAIQRFNRFCCSGLPSILVLLSKSYRGSSK